MVNLCNKYRIKERDMRIFLSQIIKNLDMIEQSKLDDVQFKAMRMYTIALRDLLQNGDIKFEN